MADEWGGPQEVTRIKGLVDSATKVPSDYGSDRIQVVLVDVEQTYRDGEVKALETRTLYNPTEGEPAAVLAASIRKVAGLAPTSKALLSVLEGRIVTLDVGHKDFRGKDGETHTMTLYRLVELGSPGATAQGASEEDVLAYLNGKTPAEAIAGRSKFSGTPYAALLASKAKTLGGFNTVTLVDGHYIWTETT